MQEDVPDRPYRRTHSDGHIEGPRLQPRTTDIEQALHGTSDSQSEQQNGASQCDDNAASSMQCNAQRALTTQVREDVLTALAMPSAKVLLASFDRQR